MLLPASYSLKSIVARPGTAFAAAGGVGLVVFVFAAVLMLSQGIRTTLASGGTDKNVIVLRKGAQVELQSAVSDEDARLIADTEGIARGSDGRPLAAAELVMVLTLPKASGGVANLTVRGVTPTSFLLREKVKISEGRMFAPGSEEVVVGRAVQRRFDGLTLGSKLKVKANREVTVVGVFDAAGSGSESELWGDVDTLRAVFARRGSYSSLTARLVSPDRATAIKTSLEADPRLTVDVFSEPKYFEDQSDGLAKFIMVLGSMIAVFFSVGATIGAMITMYGSVAQRRREVGVLRALGFRRFAVMLAFLIESVALCLIGGVIGCAGAALLGFAEFSTMNFTTFSEVVFRFHPSVELMGQALLFATVMGVFGGLLPAIRAARIAPASAMRE